MVAQTNQQRSIDLAAKFIQHTRDEPTWFAREALNHKTLKDEPTLQQDPGASWELDQFQIDVLEACADVWRKRNGIATRINHDGCNYITVRSGHGPGKTHLAALVAHWFNTAFRGRVVCTAPKLAQLRTRLWSALRKIDTRAEAWYRSTHVIHDTAVYWMKPDMNGKLIEDKDWCVLAETASHPENLAGHHEQYQLVIVEEASGVPEHLYPVIFGALSTGVVQILLMISNPTKQTGTFAASHLKESEAANYYRYHVTLKNARRINRTWVDSMIRKYGKDSPVVKVRCLGEFAATDSNQLISLEWIAAARMKEVDPKGGDGSKPRLRVSVDCAAGGENETVCCAMRHFEAVRVGLKMTRHSFALAQASIETATAAERLFEQFGGVKGQDDFVVDSLGVGVGAAGELIARGHRVVTYQGGAQSADITRWRCRRVQSYMALRNDLRDGTVSLEDDFMEHGDWDDLEAQLCSVRTVPSTERVEDLMTRQQMKDDGITSPDMADTLAMQYATQVPQTLTAAVARKHGETPRAGTMHVVRSTINSGLDGV